MATTDETSTSITLDDESFKNGEFVNGESSPAELPIGQIITSLDVPGENNEVQNKLYYQNNNGISSTPSHSPCPSPLPFCASCQKLEADSQAMVTQLTSKFETDITRLKREVEMATKAKETMVMKYANSEMEVMKLKRNVENSDKLIQQLNKETEILHKKQKMLSTERERLSLMIDSKVHEIEGLQKEVNRLNQEISSRDFKITWTTNKLREETEAHKSTQTNLESRIQEIETELEKLRSSQAKVVEDIENVIESSAEVDENSSNENESEIILLNVTPDSNTLQQNATLKELEIFKQKNRSLVEENTSLSLRVKCLEQERLEIEEKISRLQESNSEHLHQIATLHSDLAATETLKVELQKEKDLVTELKKECQNLRQVHTDLLSDMAQCSAKEADLLSYTQQVTEKNVALQSEFSSVEAKSFVLEEENERLHRQIEQLEKDLSNLEKMMSQESKHYRIEKQSVESDAENHRSQISQLQLQLDEARGEIILLNKKLNSSVRELSKELHVARKQVKDGQTCSDALSQSSRTSSSSSLANGDGTVKHKPDDSPNSEKHTDQENPVIPDQQILIERIVKLQRTLAKKQDKLEFLQEHVKQLVESLQRKSRIIQTYAMSQDTEALSSNISEQNKAEVLKHGGIMASVYGSKSADDTMTLDLSLEINRKLQVVLEDSLLKNITLKDSLNTLGKEISKLTEENQKLRKEMAGVPK